LEVTAPSEAFFVWSIGASLFAFVLSGISVSYFDQSMIFFWLDVAVISSAYSAIAANQPGDAEIFLPDQAPEHDYQPIPWADPEGGAPI
jgi:hypothetical protein